MPSISYASWQDGAVDTPTTRPDPATLPPHLELLDPIGQGGMGTVWKVQDRRDGRLAAAKTVQVVSPDRMVGLKHEFRTARQVVHPNLVALYELYAAFEHALFTMEFVPGVPLASVRMDPATLRARLGSLCAALAALHEAGLVHGDVKSANVLVQDDGRVVLLDLGLARRAGEPVSLRRDGLGPIGTPGTLSPELLDGADAHPAADAYALGVLLYECLAGSLPTHGTFENQAWQARGRWFPSPAEVSPTAPAELSELSMALLDPDPSKRPTVADAAAVFRAPDQSVGTLWIARPAAERAVRNAWATARIEGCTLVVRGPGGVGKSSLVRRMVPALGAPVCWGTASPVEHLPYQALDSALDALWQLEVVQAVPAAERAPAERLFRTLGRSAAEPPLTAGEAAAAVRCLVGLVERVATRGGVVLVVDDLQWAGEDCQRVLRALLAQPRPGLLTVLISRPEGRALARELAGAPVELALGGLDVERVRERLAAHLDPARGRALTDLLARDGHVLPASLMLVRARGAPDVGWREALRARLDALAPDARDSLVVGCLSARPLSPRMLDAVGASETGARALVAAGLLAVRNDAGGAAAVVPVHDLVREAVEAWVADAERWHLRLARWFADQGDPAAGATAHHFRLGGDRDRAASASRRAGLHALAQGAFGLALRLLDQSVALGAPGVAVAEPRGLALASLGRHPEAIDVWLRGADESDGHQRVSLLSRAADLLFGGGHMVRGVDALRTLMAAADERLQVGGLSLLGFVWNTVHAAWRTRRPGPMDATSHQQVKLEALWTTANSLTPFDPVAGQSIHARHRALSFACGDARHRAQALGSQLLFRLGQGWSVERELGLLEGLMPHVEDGVRGYVHGCHGYGLRLGCRFRRSSEVLRHALTFFGDQEQRFWYSRFGAVALLLNDAYQVPLAELDARSREVVHDAAARSDKAARLGIDLSITWLVRLLGADDPAGAHAVLDALPDIWGRELQPEQQLRRAIARVQILLYAADRAAARELLYRPPRAVRRLWRFKLIPFYWWLARGRLSLATGEAARVAEAIRGLEKLGRPSAHGAAALLRAGAAAAAGRSPEPHRAEAMRELAVHQHRLFAMALGDDALDRLRVHGVQDPERTRRWLTGVGS